MSNFEFFQFQQDINMLNFQPLRFQGVYSSQVLSVQEVESVKLKVSSETLNGRVKVEDGPTDSTKFVTVEIDNNDDKAFERGLKLLRLFKKFHREGDFMAVQAEEVPQSKINGKSTELGHRLLLR